MVVPAMGLGGLIAGGAESGGGGTSPEVMAACSETALFQASTLRNRFVCGTPMNVESSSSGKPTLPPGKTFDDLSPMEKITYNARLFQ
jgi:hypothetical protein